METMDEILARMERAYETAGGPPVEAASDTGLRLRVLAGELTRLQAETAWLRRQAFPQTAAGEWLDRHGETRGLARRPAEKARGKLVFSRYLPLSFDLVIPAGTVCASTGENPAEYETVEDAVLAAGELKAEAPAQAVAGGPSGNAAAGRINTMIDVPDGINYVNNPAPFTGGKEAEGDEAFRARVLAAVSLAPNSGNAAYYRDAALSCAGVGSVGVVPRKDGPGTVGVYLWGADGAPSEDLIAQVRETLDSLREVAVTVTVQAATAVTANVDMWVKLRDGADFDTAKAAIEQAVTDWFAGRGVGDSVYLSELARVVLNAAPVLRLEWPVTMMDVKARTGRIPVLGRLTVGESA